MTRDHPVYPRIFEWAADLMTRYANVGDLGKTAVQLIRKQKHCAIRREDLVQTAETFWSPSRKHGGHVLGWHLSGHETAIRRNSYRNDQRSYQDAHTSETSGRTMDNEFAKSIKGEPQQPVPGMNSDHVPAAISDRAGVHLEEDQTDARLGQQGEGIDPPEAREVSMPPDRLVTQVRSDTLKRMFVTRGLEKKDGPTPGCPGCATIGSHHQASHSDTCRSRMREELEKS